MFAKLLETIGKKFNQIFYYDLTDDEYVHYVKPTSYSELESLTNDICAVDGNEDFETYLNSVMGEVDSLEDNYNELYRNYEQLYIDCDNYKEILTEIIDHLLENDIEMLNKLNILNFEITKELITSSKGVEKFDL